MGASPGVLIGAILAGATFGDSISPISDTTIASAGTQGADIGGVVRSRLKYVLPAGLAAAVASGLLYGLGTGGAPVPAAGGLSLSARGLPMLAVPALVIVLLLRKRHLIEGLLFGIVAATALGLALGLIAPSATGLLDRLVHWATRPGTTPRGTETWIVGAVSGAILLTTHSIVSMLAVGEMAKKSGEAAGLSAYRRANLLDMTVCTWPFLLPYCVPTILAASTSAAGVRYGLPRVSPLSAGMHNTYSWALLAAVVVAVGTGYGRGEGEMKISANQ